MSSHSDFGLSRRQFLRLSSGIAALGLLPHAHPVTAATVTDYKALVCVFLVGGNDSANTVVTRDATHYANYYAIRRTSGLALSGSKLLPDFTDNQGNPYALHYGLPELDALRAAGKVAIVLNMGTLARPLTRAQYLTGQSVPSNLFSHSDQTLLTQVGSTNASVGTGWGGRLLDRLDQNTNSSLDAVSTAGVAVFPQGQTVNCNVLPGGGQLYLNGVSWWPTTQVSPALAGINKNLAQDGGNSLRRMANTLFGNGMQLASDLQATGLIGLLRTFPATPLGRQLQDVARMIKVRANQGAGRQVFYCVHGGFDTHSGQDWNHWNLLSQLSAAMNAFYQEMHDSQLGNQVTLFTQSEFGRTLQPNTTGTDHGWGGHHFVLGDAVTGGVYGTMPSHTLGGPDDANNRGVWIPTISHEQFGATLGQWFGADTNDLQYAFPNLSLFNTSNIGFMGG